MDKLCDLKLQIKLKLKFVHLDWVLGFLWSDLYGFSQFGLLRQFRALIQLILDTLNKEDKKKSERMMEMRRENQSNILITHLENKFYYNYSAITTSRRYH